MVPVHTRLDREGKTINWKWASGACSNPLSLSLLLYRCSNVPLFLRRSLSRITKLLPPKIIKLPRHPPLWFRRSGCVPGSPLKHTVLEPRWRSGSAELFFFCPSFLIHSFLIHTNRKLEGATIQSAKDSPARTSWHLKAYLRILELKQNSCYAIEWA